MILSVYLSYICSFSRDLVPALRLLINYEEMLASDAHEKVVWFCTYLN